MVNLYARNGFLYVDYIEFGKRVRRSLKIKDTKANKRYVIRNEIPKIEARLLSGIKIDYDIKLSAFVKRAINNMKKEQTKITYYQGVERVFKFLDDRDITDYQAIDFSLVVDKLRKNKLSDATISLYFTPIRTAFSIAEQEGVLFKNPFILPKLKTKSKKDIEPYTLFQVANLIRKAEGELKTFLFIAFNTGLRSGEILALSMDDMDMENKTILVSKNKVQNTGEIAQCLKRGGSRAIPMPTSVYAYLKEANWERFTFDYKQMLYRFKALCKKLGYKVQGLHAPRHTFISISCSSGLDLKQIQFMVGHSNTDMILNTYSHFMDSKKKRDELDKAFDLAQFGLTN